MTTRANSLPASAVFLDRDGTIIQDRAYLRDPDGVLLLSGAAAAIKRLNQQNLRVIVVTNQSGIARGLISLDEYRRTEQMLGELLASEGARVDAQYFCPHLPELTGPCECRKPGLLLYRQAAEKFNLDLGTSWWIGDRMRDVLPADALGGRGILVRSGSEVEGTGEGSARFPQAENLAEAVELVLRHTAESRAARGIN